MLKRPGAATNSPASAVSLALGGWKSILRRNRCSSIWTKRRSAGTKGNSQQHAERDGYEKYSTSNGNSRAKFQSVDEAPRSGRSARAVSRDADFRSTRRGRDNRGR